MIKKPVTIAVIICLILSLSACTYGVKEDQNKYTGTVEADVFYITSEISGRISELGIKQGDEIKASQNAAKIDSKMYVLQKNEAEAALTIAKANQTSITDNPKPNISIETQNTQSQAVVDQAKAALDLAQLQIDRCSINSFVKGSILDVLVNNGEVISTGTKIAKIMDLNNKYINLYIEESKRNYVKLEQSIPIYINDKVVGNGKVIFISPESEFTPKNVETKSDKDKTVFQIKVKVDNTGSIVPGMMVDVIIK